MAINTTATQGTPYFDDWSASGNQSKNYLKILFQPGRSVQVRELNQMQSAIQDQIDKFGQNIFAEGARVLDGETEIDKNVTWVDLNLSTGAANAASDSSRPLIGKRIYTGTSLSAATVSATIMDYELKSGTEYRFYLRYTSDTANFAGSSRQHQDVKISSRTTDGDGSTGSTEYLAANAAFGTGTTTIATGYSMKIHNNSGVFFVRGYFVEATEQTKYIDTLSTTPRTNIDGKVGFLINESTVTAINDNTLYDNATGSTNASAPGADRYVITLTLALISDDSNIDSSPVHVVPTSTTNAVDVVAVSSSEVTQPVETKYNVLGDTLAQRTFEESGDYALQPFVLDLREHYDNGENRGKYTATSSPVRDATKFVAELEPGKAYVKGQRIEILTKQSIDVDKARSTEIENSLQIQASQGAYIECAAIEFLPITDLSDGDNSYTLKEGPSGATVGTCKISGINFTGRLYQIFIRDLGISSGKKVSDARFITGDSSDSNGSKTFKGGAETLTATSGASFTVFDVDVANQIFELPASVVKSVTSVSGGGNTIKIPQRLTTGNIAVSTNTVALPQLTGTQTYYQDATQEYVVVDENSGAVLSVDSVSITNNGLDCSLVLTTGHGASNVDVSYSFRKVATLRTKTKTAHTESAQSATTYAVGDTITLDKKDVFQMVSLNNGSGTSFLDNFQLDNGQTAISYEFSKLICIKAVTTSEALTPVYNYFEVDAANSSKDAFWVDSYEIDDAEGGTAVARGRIGTFLGTPLLDALDFRGSSTSLDPNGIIEIDNIEYFLPRYDRIVIQSNGELKYLTGDAVADTPPPIPDNAMLLYDLDVPAYTESAAGIEIGYVDNRRYTMKDIARLEKRVSNLEYYTSLSLLEKMSKDQAIPDDATGDDRFKNGIIVDEFKGHGVGNAFDSGYRVAIEPEKGVLRPSFETFNIGIYNTDNTANDATVTGSGQIGAEDMLRMKAASVHELIKQPFASVAISVNPFDVASWVGEIRLSPQTDEWKDTVRRPDVIIQQDDNAEAMQTLLNEKLAAEGIRWNDWNTTWSGVTGTRNLGWSNRASAIRQIEGTGGTTRSWSTRGRRRWWRRRRRWFTELSTLNGGTISGRSRRMQVQLEQEVITTRQVREGIQQFASIRNVETSQGDRVVDVSFVPFIRSRKVYFHATGFKPNTTLYPYFDGVNISGYTKKIASTDFVEFRDDTTRVDHTGHTDSDISNSVDNSSYLLTTDDAGEVYGYFVIPQNDALRFRTGEREFQLSDQQDNNLTNAMTYGKATYSARGLRQEVEEVIISTRQAFVDERRVTDSRTLTSGGRIGATAIRHRDPLAQTFVVDIDKYPQGVFLKDIDLFFKAKHSSLPVRIYLAPTENGIPTQRVIPFSEVSKAPADVSISEDASAATNFVFNSPIYLKPGVEYSVVVLSNSPDFTLWHSEVGGDDVGTNPPQRITKNPYTGVALKSANAATWTPDQNKDFKFTMRYMKFDTTQSYQIGNGSTATGFGDFVSIMPYSGNSQLASFKMDALNLFSEQVILPGTSISYTAIVDDGTNTTNYSITPGEIVEFDKTVNVDANTDIKLVATLSTTNEFLTPMFDATRLSFLAVKNNINGQTPSQLTDTSTGEGRGTHGTADARYITKMVALKNQSSRIDLYMDVKRPSSQCNVHAYVRFDHTTNWTKLETPDIPVSASFREVHFRTGTTDSGALAAGTFGERKFERFQIKLVMTSVAADGGVDSAFVPEIRNFRGIATA